MTALISLTRRSRAGHEAPRSDFMERRQGQLPCAASQPFVLRRRRHDHDVRRGRRTQPVAWTAAGARRGAGRSARPARSAPAAARGRPTRTAIAGRSPTPGHSASRHVIFGDIMYESNREFPERVCAAEGLTAVEPLWGEPTAALYREFVATGADARIVTVRDGVLDPSWLGRRLTLDLLTTSRRSASIPVASTANTTPSSSTRRCSRARSTSSRVTCATTAAGPSIWRSTIAADRGLDAARV